MPGSKFCQEHEETHITVVSAEQLFCQTRRNLKYFIEDHSKKEFTGQDYFYIVESIIDAKSSTEGELY